MPRGCQDEPRGCQDEAATDFQLVAKLTNTNPVSSVVQPKEGRILGRGRSNQPWPAGAEAEADEAAADFQLVAKLTNTNPVS